MSLLLSESPLAALPDINLPTGGGDSQTDTFTLFTIPNAIPARLETVSFQVTADPFPDDVQFGLGLIDQSGIPIAWIYSPVIQASQVDVGTFFLTWMRGGNGDAQLPLTDGTAAYDLALPELVLRPLTVLQLTILRASDGPAPAIDITNLFLSYTPAGQGTAQPAFLLTPLLLTQGNG